MNEIEREEIKRAIDHFEDFLKNMRCHETLLVPEAIPSHELALKLLRAELTRQENATLTCDGCKWHPIKYDFLNCMIKRCENCSRGTILQDRYEPKGEPTCTQD